MIETNKVIRKDDEMYQAAQELLAAANNYWKLYQKNLGSGAVVWLSNNNDHFVLFTRGEYRDAIIRAARIETRDAEVLFDPFEEEVDDET